MSRFGGDFGADFSFDLGTKGLFVSEDSGLFVAMTLDDGENGSSDKAEGEEN